MYTAFEGVRQIADGDLKHVAARAKEALQRQPSEPVLIFNDETGGLVDIDYHGPASVRIEPNEPEAPRGPGRPRLGVVAREITLLPRHWEWLNRQPGGASVALRKLVDEARRVYASRDRIRQSQEAAYRFLTALAGNEPGFEEALRALFASKKERFEEMIGNFPMDVRNHAKKLAKGAFE
jgi:uncharacterized protein